MACAQTLFVLHTPWQHGLNNDSTQAIFEAKVVAMKACASLAWWGFASTTDCNHLEASEQILTRVREDGQWLPNCTLNHVTSMLSFGSFVGCSFLV
jgi:hypothetical protein